VIEFVGSPGTGKTTSSYCFSKALKASGLQVCLIEDLEGYLKKLDKLQKLSFVFEACITRGHLLLLYIALFSLNGIFNLHAFIHYASLTLREVALKRFCKYNCIDVVLLDQWAIQALWSSTIFHITPGNGITRYLKYLYLETSIVIYFEVAPAVASQRMELRPTCRSRFDRMDAERREKELAKYDRYLFQLYSNSNCKNNYVLSTEHDPLENANAFEHILKQYQEKNVLQGKSRRSTRSICSSYLNYLSK
jgi:thymidylate kinase